MRVTLENTSRIVELMVAGHPVPARIWEGRTDKGVACHAYVTRIAVDEKKNAAEFERDLQECAPPSPAIEAIPLRMIL